MAESRWSLSDIANMCTAETALLRASKAASALDFSEAATRNQERKMRFVRNQFISMSSAERNDTGRKTVQIMPKCLELRATMGPLKAHAQTRSQFTILLSGQRNLQSVCCDRWKSYVNEFRRKISRIVVIYFLCGLARRSTRMASGRTLRHTYEGPLYCNTVLTPDTV